MADPRVDEAIDTVARTIIGAMTEVVAVTDLWDSYPEIGEHDWAAIVARVHTLGTAVADDTSGGYADAAYEFLTARATTDG